MSVVHGIPRRPVGTKLATIAAPVAYGGERRPERVGRPAPRKSLHKTFGPPVPITRAAGVGVQHGCLTAKCPHFPPRPAADGAGGR